MSLAELITSERDRAYRLALRLAGDPEAAADAVQEACASLLASGEPARVESPRAWFLKAVVHTVRRSQRQAQRRRRREEAWAVERERSPGSPSDGLDARQLHEEIGRALDALEERLRLPVELHYREGLTHAEIAAVLEVPRGSVGVQIQRGLERLRRRLKKQGSAAAPAILLAGLKDLAMPAAPAKLAAGLGRILAGSGAGKGAGAGAATAASAAAKGGIAMKLIAGVVLAGAVAGGVAVSMGGGGAPLPAEKPKFPIPVWHPDVQWSTEKECIGGSGLLGHLQGPQREIMRYSEPSFSRLFGPDAGNQPVLYSHDPKIARVHAVAGGAAGYLDGPFSRARFGGRSYGARSTGARSPNGRFVYFTEPYYGKVLRQLDLKEQRASTVNLPKGTIISMAPDDEGNVYALMSGGTLLVLDTAQGKVTRTLKLNPGDEQVGYALSWSTALDTVNNRLYATKFGAKKYYIWYWDLKDGSFHGVLAIPKEGEPVRPKPSGGGIGGCLPGPFKGTKLYNEGSVYFGPDDPKRRFLYTSRVDTSTFFRLDLEKKEIWVFAIDKGKKVFRFIGPGETGAVGTGVNGLNVLEDGSLMSTSPHWTGAHVFVQRRLK